ncbi:MAG: filamentous hemagglutinin N-terminal domain-containing protein, partial [Burkholderiales bacterium]
MNKNLHRIVFNAARGQRMAVAETAASHSRASSGGNAGMATAVAFAAITLLAPAHAQIAADPSAPGNQRPTVLAAPNGVPVVNIQTPSAAGVSRNTYSQFDVNKAGAVLNNSRGNVQTQLGGWVQGNPWLATGSARVILNEVNSSSPSRLNGYVEVAGPRTEVIIANPAGIRVDGAGFINASRVTLTTGTPVVNAGNLESYRVQGGSVNISGAGLDTRGADLTAIYARAVEVNAGLWADYLRVTTGTNQIGPSSGEPPSITPVDGTGARPAFALDIAALGGMYAGHIFLVGNEYGVGVNNQGTLAAGGKLVLQANGWLANAGTIQATGDVQVQTQGLTSSGTVYAGGNGSLVSTGSIANTGLVAAQGSMTVQATGAGASITSSQGGAFFSGVAPDGRLGGGGILSLEATSVIALHGQVSAGQIAITTGTLDTGGGLLTGGQLSIQAQRVSNAGGEIAQTGAADLNILAGTIDNTAGRITTAGSLVASATLANGNGLQNAGGLIAANGSVTVTATRLDNAGGTIAAVQGNIALTTTEGAINNDSGKLQAALDVLLAAKGVSNTTAAVAAQGAPGGSITGRNVLVNTGAIALNNQSGTIVATGTLDLETGALNNASGYLGAAGNMKLNTGSAAITNTAGAQIVTQSTITITGSGLNNQGGQVQSVGDLIIDSGAGTADNTSGLLRSGGTTQLTAGVITNSATSAVDQGIEGRTVSLAATTLANATGSIRADNSVTINASGVLDNTNGLISANKALTVQDSLARALALSNAGGTLIAGETASISAAGLTGAGKVLSKGTLDLDFAGGLNNAGEIIANGDLNLSSAADVVNTGKIQSGAALNLAARNVANAATGEISSVNTAITAGSTFTNRGLIDGIDTRVDAATLDNIGTGRIYGNHVSLYAAAVNNDAETVAGVTSAATIAARDRLDIGASVVNNREHALIFSAGDAFVGRSLDANRQATGQALAVNNASATIEALGQLGLNAADVNNTNNHFVMTKGAPKVEALTEVMYDAATGHVNAGQVFIYQQRQQPTNPNSYFNATLLSTYAREDGPDIYANMGDCWCEVGSGFTAEWSEYRFQRATITDTVASSDPGRLLSGGAMSINGNLLNDKSQAIAGGTLGVVGVVAKNTDPDATTSTSDTGETRFHTFVKGNFHGIDFWTPWAPYTPATAVTKAVVPVSVFAANTTPVGSGLAIAGAGTTSVTTGIGAAGAASGSLRAVAITQVSLGGGGVIRTVGGSAGMPSASLFRQTPPSAGYLIETDPRFTSFGNWVSSDYLLSALGIDAAGLQKRLGDGFYEQRLVREQVAQLTGQRFLGNYASDDEQFKALMNAGATQAKAFNLRPGIALTQEQMAQLTSDIVWLVEQSVTLPDGSTARALVPQVYARVKAADLDGSGT